MRKVQKAGSSSTRSMDANVESDESACKIPSLSCGLDKVLFSPGPHTLQCERSQVYNFDSRLQRIVQPDDFNFSQLREFIPSSKDSALHQMASKLGCKFATSTSSLSSPLSLLYFCLFGLAKSPSIETLSLHYKNEPMAFTNLMKSPVSFIVEPHSISDQQHSSPNTIYSILIEKTSNEDETILMKMGNILEMKLTHCPEEFAQFEKSSSNPRRFAKFREQSVDLSRKSTDCPNSNENSTKSKDKSSSKTRTVSMPDSPYAYCQSGSILVRSQIDCGNEKLPRKTFDIKTRACFPTRMDPTNYQNYDGYKITSLHGLYYSYEREYYDMARSAFLKYSFQVKLGNMDGIFVAFHNVFEIFGFQYISREELDDVLYGNNITGEICHQFLLRIFSLIMEKLVDAFPYAKESFRVILDVKKHQLMNIFIERYAQNSQFNLHAIPTSLHHFTLHLYPQINGIRTDNILLDPNGSDNLNIFYQLNHIPAPLLSEYLAAKKKMSPPKSSNHNFIQSVLRNPRFFAKDFSI